MYRTVSQFFGFYPKFIQGKKSHKNQTEKFKTKLRKIRQNPRKTLDIFALCPNKIQLQNYTFVIPLFLLIQKLYEKSAVSHAHRELKKYTTFNYLSLLIRMSLVRVQLPEPRFTRLSFWAVFLWFPWLSGGSIIQVIKRAIFQALSNRIIKKVRNLTFFLDRVKSVHI